MWWRYFARKVLTTILVQSMLLGFLDNFNMSAILFQYALRKYNHSFISATGLDIELYDPLTQTFPTIQMVCENEISIKSVKDSMSPKKLYSLTISRTIHFTVKKLGLEQAGKA